MSNPINIDDFTQDKILELAGYHVAIAHFVRLWERKELTWEQCCYGIIFALLERNTDLTKDLMAFTQLKYIPTLKVKDIPPETISQIANYPSSILYTGIDVATGKDKTVKIVATSEASNIVDNEVNKKSDA